MPARLSACYDAHPCRSSDEDVRLQRIRLHLHTTPENALVVFAGLNSCPPQIACLLLDTDLIGACTTADSGAREHLVPLLLLCAMTFITPTTLIMVDRYFKLWTRQSTLFIHTKPIDLERWWSPRTDRLCKVDPKTFLFSVVPSTPHFVARLSTEPLRRTAVDEDRGALDLAGWTLLVSTPASAPGFYAMNPPRPGAQRGRSPADAHRRRTPWDPPILCAHERQAARELRPATHLARGRRPTRCRDRTRRAPAEEKRG